MTTQTAASTTLMRTTARSTSRYVAIRRSTSRSTNGSQLAMNSPHEVKLISSRSST